MTIPKELFTPESMLTLTGAAGITFVVCNALQSALNFNPRWLALGSRRDACGRGRRPSGCGRARTRAAQRSFGSRRAVWT